VPGPKCPLSRPHLLRPRLSPKSVLPTSQALSCSLQRKKLFVSGPSEMRPTSLPQEATSRLPCFASQTYLVFSHGWDPCAPAHLKGLAPYPEPYSETEEIQPFLLIVPYSFPSHVSAHPRKCRSLCGEFSGLPPFDGDLLPKLRARGWALVTEGVGPPN